MNFTVYIESQNRMLSIFTIRKYISRFRLMASQ